MTDTAKTTLKQRPVVLCVLDGWGDRDDGDDNAIARADTPNWSRMVREWPTTRLNASERDVGLPEGQMGNSEVGHTNLGAGRVVMQDLLRIDKAIDEGTLADIDAMRDFVGRLTDSGGTAHLMGLMSPGGVHSMQGHIGALARILDDAGVPVVVHAFLDGRDTPPRSAVDYVRRFLDDVADCGRVRIGTVAGRYYAMDRDNRWDRVAKAYAAMVDAEGEHSDDPVAAIEASYDRDASDEFVLPTAIGDYAGMRDGDGILMANFRTDRAREILSALVDPGFDGFERARTVDLAGRLGMVEYSDELTGHMATLFPPEELTNILGEVVANAGLTQLRIAETEKYAHVTFFFNGGQETRFAGEERILVPSPRVATYDQQPEMSAPEVTDRMVEAIESGRFDVVIANYANGDMVGHTGRMDAAIQAAEAVDAALGRVEAAVRKAGGILLVTADHGNCEQMADAKTGQAHTAHTLNPVPLVLVNAPDWANGLRDGGRLADVAPTMLHLMGMEPPAEMTGRSLVGREPTRARA